MTSRTHDNISRLFSVGDNAAGTATLEGLTYLGLGTVTEQLRGNGVNLTHLGTPGDGGDQYAGLDRFGRIATMKWTNGTTTTDSLTYGYDRNGNRLYEENLLAPTLSELYVPQGGSYDGLNRLTSFERGELAEGHKTELDGIASRSQSWNLDVLGNWNSVTNDGVAQSRTHDKQNRLTAAGGTGLTHSPNGEMTANEQGNPLTYDARAGWWCGMTRRPRAAPRWLTPTTPSTAASNAARTARPMRRLSTK